MPVRYAPMIAPEKKEFVEPTASDSFIWWLFKHLCVVCHKPATEINEIFPRSRSKKSITTWENRVTMCRECHNEYHRHGVNSKTQDELIEKRTEALRLFGREAYINYIPLEKIEPLEIEFDNGAKWIIDVTENTIRETASISIFGISKRLIDE